MVCISSCNQHACSIYLYMVSSKFFVVTTFCMLNFLDIGIDTGHNINHLRDLSSNVVATDNFS